ncbi:hypothetical protein J3A78_007544 [Streptomyces sp. PvR006]|uniref:hypothetical protein n=1 Tax=Streptomyces sp. PvR006 TaxID=2817860 RepID=UPI001AE81C5C|nr:hypothetical protein [Streptomyces sp. PvR006]MBP2587066.1 hypothetical protein [Streptomyces sp. PvR006]
MEPSTVAYSTLADVSLRGPLAPLLVGVLAVHWMMPLWGTLRVQDQSVDGLGDAH